LLSRRQAKLATSSVSMSTAMIRPVFRSWIFSFH